LAIALLRSRVPLDPSGMSTSPHSRGSCSRAESARITMPEAPAMACRARST
jgi:hypothetical protein